MDGTIFIGSSNADVVTPSSWLANCNLDVVEFTSDNENDVVSSLLQCEVILAVLDPYHSPSETLKPLSSILRNDLLPSMTVINGPTIASVAGRRDLSDCYVCADAAISANTALLDVSSASSIEAYQEQFNASGIGRLQDAIHRVAAGLGRQTVALRTAILALQSMYATLESDSAANNETRQMARELRESAEEAASETKPAVQGDDLAQSRQQLESLFQSRWSWLNLISRMRIDDCGREVAEMIQASFGRRLEQEVSPASCPQ